jgi:TonB family protein
MARTMTRTSLVFKPRYARPIMESGDAPLHFFLFATRPAGLLLLLSACGGGASTGTGEAVEPATLCATPRPVAGDATFGDLLDDETLAAGEDVCLSAGQERVGMRWAETDRLRITLSPDAVDAGSTRSTLCAWYGRCDAATGQRALIDDESVLSTVDCLLETGGAGGVVIQASRDVSAQTLVRVAGRVSDAGRDVVLERRPVSFLFPCQPGRRARRRSQIPEEVVRSAVTPRMRQVRRCYHTVRAPRAERAGRVVLRFVVSPDGAVEDASVATSTLEAPAVEQCILEQVRSWIFEAPGVDEPVVVTYPLDLGPRR